MQSHVYFWRLNLMSFNGPMFEFPLLKPHVFCWTQNFSCFLWTLPLLKPRVIWWTQKPHVFCWSQNFSCFLWTLPLLKPHVFVYPETSCLSMDPWPHVFWWTLLVDQKTWVPKIGSKLVNVVVECPLIGNQFLKCFNWTGFNANVSISQKLLIATSCL